MNENSQNKEPFDEESSKHIKKKPKPIFKLVLMLLILGGGLAAVGLGMGAKTSLSGAKAEQLMGITVHSNTRADVTEVEISKDFVTSNGEIKYLENLNLESFSKIKSDSIYMDIEIIEADNYGIEISYNQKQGEYSYEVEDDTLKIKNKSKSNINFKLNNMDENYIKIYVPKDADFQEIDIDNVSGFIFLESLNVKNLKVNSTSADIELDNVKSEKLVVKSVSGYISTSDLTSNHINYSSTSGDMKFENITNSTDGVEEISSISGSIDISDSSLQNSTIKTTSGKINIDSSKVEGLTAKSVSGSINMKGEFLKTTSLHSTSGKILLDTSIPKSEYNYDISSSSGSIHVDDEKFKKSITQNNGENSSNEIKISTTSGSIELDFK